MSIGRRNGRGGSRPWLFAAGLAALIAAPASSSAAMDCRTGAGPSAPALASGAQEQRRQIAILRSEMDERGCDDSIVAVGSPASGRCEELDGLMARMQENLTRIEEQQAALAAASAGPLRPASLPCSPRTAPIPGVSQFLNPPQANVVDLSPHRRPTVRATPDDAHSIMHIELPPAADESFDSGPDAAPAIDVEVEPPAIARPMTRRDREVRRVGPRFLPDPDQSLHLKRETGNRAR